MRCGGGGGGGACERGELRPRDHPAARQPPEHLSHARGVLGREGREAAHLEAHGIAHGDAARWVGLGLGLGLG